jgi:periplasmic copper chaperone A
MKSFALATALLVIGVGAASAQTVKAGNIEVIGPWAPATTESELTNSAAYMALTDQGTAPDELISASSPVAKKVELHVFDVENGVYGMHRVDVIQVSPGAAATVLRPGGAHVMLEGLKKPLKVGESFPLSLSFKNAGELRLQVEVKSPQAVVANVTQ